MRGTPLGCGRRDPSRVPCASLRSRLRVRQIKSVVFRALYKFLNVVDNQMRQMPLVGDFTRFALETSRMQ